MNRTDAFLMIERLRDGLHKLPVDAKVHGFDTVVDMTTDTHRHIDIHLSAPVEWPAVIDGKRFPSWVEKRICVTPWVYAWWAEHFEEEDDDGTNS